MQRAINIGRTFLKKKILLVFHGLLTILSIAHGQEKVSDSLKAVIHLHAGDTSEVNAIVLLGRFETNGDSAIKYSREGLKLARKLDYKKGEADCLFIICKNTNDFSESIQNGLEALRIYENLNDYLGMISANILLQFSYYSIGDYQKGLYYAFAGKELAEANNVKEIESFRIRNIQVAILGEIAQIYVLSNQPDSALIYTQKAIDLNELHNGTTWNFPIYLLATIQTMQGNYKAALDNYHSAYKLAIQNHLYHDTLQIFAGLSTLFIKTNRLDSSTHYAQIVSQSKNPDRELKNFLEAVNNLALIYKSAGPKDSALKYIQLNHHMHDSIFSVQKDRQIQSITFNERLNQQKLVADQEKYKRKVQLYSLLGGVLALLLIAGILLRNNRHKQKAYSLLVQQKKKPKRKNRKSRKHLKN